MLNKISFKNYKAFSDGEIKIKPITILLGANSVGKSSILQLILMLQQTALSEKKYKSALKLHGGYVSMGEGLNLIRKKDNTKPFSITIDVNSEKIFKDLKSKYFHSFYQDVVRTITFLKILLEKRQNTNNMKEVAYVIDDNFLVNNLRKVLSPDKIEKDSFRKLIDDFNQLVKSYDPKQISKERVDNHLLFYFDHFNPIGNSLIKGSGKHNHIQLLKDKYEEYLFTFDFLEGISKDIKEKDFNVTYCIVIKEKILFLDKISIYNGTNEIVSIKFGENSLGRFKPQLITSKYIDQSKIGVSALEDVDKIFESPRTIFSFVVDLDNNENQRGPFSNFVKFLISTFNTCVSDCFENDNINYVSPLRAHPKRYYFLDKAKINTYVDTLDGDAIAEILKENAQLKKQVNNWLKKFNLKVNVEHLEDIIHKVQVNQNSLNLDITDVGFGISQVLPVIIQGFLSHKNSLTLIEQPEIHLHPKMQADLADLFIEIAFTRTSRSNGRKPSKYLLIETHSEYLLKRLRRRISDGTISSENVAIYLIDPDIKEQGATIRELKIQDRGAFDWPTDFYGGELLKDTTEFFKNQKM
jgi:predicted ATPase